MRVCTPVDEHSLAIYVFAECFYSLDSAANRFADGLSPLVASLRSPLVSEAGQRRDILATCAARGIVEDARGPSL